MHGPLTRLLPSSIPAVLIASVVLVTLLAWAYKPLQHAFILMPYRVGKGEIYRLLTAGWLHGDGSHLLFNMITLYFFADQLIKVLGETRFLILYVTAVVMAFIPTTVRYMDNPRYSSLGASGGVTAVMFGAILLYPDLKLYLMLIPIPVPGWMFAIGYLAYCIWQSYTARDNVNHDAHFSGAVCGALITYLFEPARVMRTLKLLF